ncbi:hypothetical protein Tco_0262448 [Tanacetum coccineum]
MDCGIQMHLESFQAQGHTHVRGVAIQEPVVEAIRTLLIVEGKDKAIVTEEQAAQSLLAQHTPKRRSTTDQFILQRAESDKTNSEGDTEILHIAEELGEDVTNQVNLEEKTAELDQDQAGSDLGKLNVEAKVVSMVTVLIYQASSSVPLLSTPVIDLSPPKPASSTTQTPIFTATTTTTTTPLPPPPQQQSTTESELAERVAALEKKLSDLEQTNKNLDNITRNLGSRVYTLELRDLPHTINEVVCENVKEAVQIALQAPLRDHFRDLSEEDMKEMLHQRMFETGFYKSLPEHITLYEALEASMEHPPPPPPDSDQSKRRRHDVGASGSLQLQAPQLLAWKKSDTRYAPSRSSKQQSGPHAKQLVDDIPIQDSNNISDSEDTDFAHLPKTKQRPEWLKPISYDERPATPEPA